MRKDTDINPVMITVARESRGWTQTNLAHAIGVSQPKICLYELGTIKVSDEDAQSMAQALDYSSRLFTQSNRIYDPISSIFFYRRRVRVPIREQRRICAEVNIRKMQLSQLLKSGAVETEHTFPRVPPEEFDGNVELVARHLRDAWRIPKGRPIDDLTQVVESAGGIVVHMDFRTNLVDGTHLLVSGLPPMFFMNPTVPGERYRFSLAHEIGHAIMHPSVSRDDEDDADRFASELLMPRATIRPDLRGINLQSAERLKRVWKVSIAALIMRAKRLNQISESKYRRLFTQLSATGKRMQEPWPVELERPTVLDDLVSFHRRALNLPEHDMREILFTNRFGPLDRPQGKKPKFRVVSDQ